MYSIFISILKIKTAELIFSQAKVHNVLHTTDTHPFQTFCMKKMFAWQISFMPTLEILVTFYVFRRQTQFFEFLGR